MSSPLPVDLRWTLGPLRCGSGDPSLHRAGEGTWWRAWHTPQGPVAARYRVADEHTVKVDAWGEGADWAIAQAGATVGALDTLEGFDPTLHPKVERAHRRFPRIRIGRSGLVSDALVQTILGQKVTGVQAHRAWVGLVRRHGAPAPGPHPHLRLPPTMEQIGRLPYWAFHPLGVEQRRAEVIIRSARRIDRLQEAVDMPRDEAMRRLCALPGLGPWTAGILLRQCCGDPDAVEVGDYHLPDMVSYTLAGEPRGTDERMLELLEPFAGHRGRVMMLLKAGGSGKPRYGARMTIHAVEDL